MGLIVPNSSCLQFHRCARQDGSREHLAVFTAIHHTLGYRGEGPTKVLAMTSTDSSARVYTHDVALSVCTSYSGTLCRGVVSGNSSFWMRGIELSNRRAAGRMDRVCDAPRSSRTADDARSEAIPIALPWTENMRRGVLDWILIEAGSLWQCQESREVNREVWHGSTLRKMIGCRKEPRNNVLPRERGAGFRSRTIAELNDGITKLNPIESVAL